MPVIGTAGQREAADASRAACRWVDWLFLLLSLMLAACSSTKVEPTPVGQSRNVFVDLPDASPTASVLMDGGTDEDAGENLDSQAPDGGGEVPANPWVLQGTMESEQPLVALPEARADAGAVPVSSDETEPLNPRGRTICEGLMREAPKAERQRASCFQEGARVWGVVLGTQYAGRPGLRPENEEGKWRLALSDGAGRSKWSPAFGYHCWLMNCRRPDVAAPESAVLFDFDGDGQSEIGLVRRSLVDSTCRTEPTVEFWTGGGGRLRRYPGTEKLKVFWVADYDSDGRPDLFVNPYPGVNLGFLGWHARSLTPWALLAHSLPGGKFSLDDEVARAYAENLCPTEPKDPFSTGREAWPAAAHCARLWGADGKRLEASLRSRCDEIRTVHPAQYSRYGEMCELKELTPVFRAKLPLRLQGPPALPH